MMAKRTQTQDRCTLLTLPKSPSTIVIMWRMPSLLVSAVLALSLSLSLDSGNSFSFQGATRPRIAFFQTTATPAATATVAAAVSKASASSSTFLLSSFAADGSEYSSKDGGDSGDDEDDAAKGFGEGFRDDQEDETPTVELQPIPTSKNSGNRFIAFVYDRLLDTEKRDALDLHYARNELTEEHVMFCRKNNLYNETFNQDSMADILWSLPILSVDLKRVIGHAMCLESSKLEYAQEVLARDPIINMLTEGDLTDIPLYRWRHIRDYSLRQDDGRFGFPCMMLGLDQEPEEVGNLREQVTKDNLEYLIRSERVIAVGPLHLPSEFKDDPSSIPVGDFVLFNAKDRDDAIDFAENLPSAEDGLYKDLRVNFYNSLDITGKFVSEDPLRDAPGGEMKEALEYWGYPTEDDQTPWLNC